MINKLNIKYRGSKSMDLQIATMYEYLKGPKLRHRSNDRTEPII